MKMFCFAGLAVFFLASGRAEETTLGLTEPEKTKEIVPVGHEIVVTPPEGWEQPPGVSAPILVAAVDPSTGRSFGVIGLRQPDAKYQLNRKEADKGLKSELGASGKVLRRFDTKLLGVPAYGVVAEVEEDGHTVSILRIMAEKPVNGVVYAVQASKFGGGDFAKDEVQDLTGRVRVKEPPAPQFRP